MSKKTPAGKGIRYGEGKSTWIRMADYRRAKKIGKQLGVPINQAISKALKFFEDNGGSQAAAP